MYNISINTINTINTISMIYRYDKWQPSCMNQKTRLIPSWLPRPSRAAFPWQNASRTPATVEAASSGRYDLGLNKLTPLKTNISPEK